MPWSSSNRKDTLPSDWETLRVPILKRDKYRCQWIKADGTKCLEHANQVDHKDNPLDHSAENLQSLCEYHHSIKSSAEGVAARQQKRQEIRQRFRHDEVHPAYRHGRRG